MSACAALALNPYLKQSILLRRLRLVILYLTALISSLPGELRIRSNAYVYYLKPLEALSKPL
ncbi:hypothetical protein ALT1644_190042 [Alteromonas macleodii]|jgi:hypothetical protein